MQGKLQRYEYAKEDRSIIELAHKNSVKVTALIANLPDSEEETWDSSRVEKVISSKVTRAQHIAQIVAKAEKFGFDGITIDYEEVSSKQRDNFSFFIKELQDELSKKGKFAGVALHPKTAEAKKGEEIGWFQDWPALGKTGAQLYLMTYGEHWDTGPAGPIASVGWIKQVIAYVNKIKLPKERVFLGVPFYGYAWPKGNDQPAVGLTFAEIQKILRSQGLTYKWDERAKAPYFKYIQAKQEYEVWFENAKSVDEKVRLAHTNGFAGVSFWRLGEEDPLVWDTIKSSY